MKTHEKMRSELGEENERDVYSVLDVAKWVLYEAKRRKKKMTIMRLQKYLMYIQAYGAAQVCYCSCMAIPVFREAIHVGVYGPEIPEIQEEYRRFGASPITNVEVARPPKEEMIWINIPFNTRGHLTDRELCEIVRNEQIYTDNQKDGILDVGGMSVNAHEPESYYPNDEYGLPRSEADYYEDMK